jgi:CRP/FNR family transcriptional regulator
MKTITETDKDFICDIQAPCFSMLSVEEAELVRESRTQVQFRKGDTLTKQGAFASYVLFVMTGLAKQYIEGDGSRSFNLRIIRPGEFIGLSSVFNKNTFTYSAVALTECQVFLIEKTTLANVIKQNGPFAFSFVQRYCEQNSDLTITLRNVIYKQMNGRMADTLLYIDSLKDEFPGIFQYLTRRDLADFAGISMESAVKLLKSFEKDGIIQLNDKDIRLVSHDSLHEISRIG